MTGFLDFLGAATARLLGLIALVPAASLIRNWIGYDPGTDPLPLVIRAAVTILLLISVGLLLLSPAGTRRLLHRRRTVAGRAAFALASLLLLVMILFYAVGALPRIAPQAAPLVRPFAALCAILGMLYVGLFLFPGTYARRLALTKDPADSDPEGSPEFATLRQHPSARAEGPARTGQGAAAARHETARRDDLHERLRSYGGQRARTAPARQETAAARRALPRRPFLVAALCNISALFVVTTIMLTWYGMQIAQFVPTAEVAALAPDIRLPLIVAVGIFGAVAAITADGRRRGVAKSLTVRLLSMAGAGVVVVLFGADSFVTRGLPGAHSFFVDAPESEITLEIARIGGKIVRGGCDYRVVARGEDYAGLDGVVLCEVGRELWPTLKPGERITLHGYATPYGFRYERISR